MADLIFSGEILISGQPSKFAYIFNFENKFQKLVEAAEAKIFIQLPFGFLHFFLCGKILKGFVFSLPKETRKNSFVIADVIWYLE